MLAVRTFLGWNPEEWQAIGAVVAALLTFGLLVYAIVQVQQAKELRDEQARPFVIVDFAFRSQLIALTVHNIGRTAAFDVKVTLDEELTSAALPHGVPWQQSALFTTGMPLFAPGREIDFALDVFSARVEADLPMTVTGTVHYWRPHRAGDPITEQFTLDLSGFTEALLPPKALPDLADEAEKVRKLIERHWRPGT